VCELRIAAALALALLAGCARQAGTVDAGRYDAFWLWAGTKPQPALARARTVYVLDSELRDGARALTALRPAVPHVPGIHLWLVTRVETLDWPEGTTGQLVRRLDAWHGAGNEVAGLQVDFDARTRHLDRYGEFLRRLRRELPPQYLMSITGLMDWSAHGDPQMLKSLAGTVDEVVIQTYQGRTTIPGYERYFAQMGPDFPLPFKVGLVQGGAWTPPAELEQHPRFRGYVVFLVNRRR
jgi:hypothetical protein